MSPDAFSPHMTEKYTGRRVRIDRIGKEGQSRTCVVCSLLISYLNDLLAHIYKVSLL